jgi:hypothetical protein
MDMSLVESLILRLCQQPRTFEFISKNLKGLDPIKAKEVLDVLKARGAVNVNKGMWLVEKTEQKHLLTLFPNESELYLKKYMGYFDFLKTPHPLDFEWRNSTSSLVHLVDKVAGLCTIKDSILMLGMPTLFATASLKDIPQKVTLIERNKPILQGLRRVVNYPDRFKMIEEDLFNIIPTAVEKHFCVVMDPPWYREHFFHFIWVASQCVEIGGLVGISIPSINTRPEIPEERIEWLSFCHQLGLCIETLEAQLLEYAMPFFEFNAIRAAGIKDVMPFWRKGDFIMFRKVSSKFTARPSLPTIVDEWIEREIGSVRFRIKLTLDGPGEKDKAISITSIVKGDILPTVSRRHELRGKANIWTSGNRIFATNNPTRFLELLDNAIKEGFAKNEENAIVIDFVELILKLESKEFEDYLECIYYEMERQAT